MNDASKALGCYHCDRTFSTAKELDEHERLTGHGELRPAEVVPVPLTDGSTVYNVHAWAWMWSEDEGTMIQKLITFDCETWGHANMLVHVLNHRQTQNIGIDA